MDDSQNNNPNPVNQGPPALPDTSQNANVNNGGNAPRPRFGRPANNNNGNNSPPPPPPNRFSNFNRRRQLEWAILPTNKIVVRFDLEGLGDPFYRLLGHPLNADYGESKVVAKALQQGRGDAVQMQNLLNRTWAGYGLSGAALVYRWNTRTLADLAAAEVIPPRDGNAFDDPNQGEQPSVNDKPSALTVTCLRALDLQLVLNVLARSRTQLLLISAPLVFSDQYLTRSILTDDVRFVNLVRATGYIQERL